VLGPRSFVVVAGDPPYNTHGTALIEFVNRVKADEKFSDLVSSFRAENSVDLLGELERRKVDGHVERREGVYNHFVVRIEDHERLFQQARETRDTKPVLEMIQMYREAIGVAKVLAETRGGQISIEAESDSAKRIADMLGALHLVGTISAPRQNFRSKVEEHHDLGPVYYARATGTRYITPSQLETTKELANDRENLLGRLGALVAGLDPTYRNSHGKREYAFLMFNPMTSQFNENAADHNELHETLKDCFDVIGQISKKQWNTPEAQITIHRQIESLVEYFRYCFSGKPFDYDDFSNAEFVRFLQRRLSVVDGAVRFKPSFFSTPQEWLELGSFDASFTQFTFSTENAEHKAIGEWYLKTIPQGTSLTSIGLSSPRYDTLTYHQRSADETRHYQDPPDDSVIIRAGDLLAEREIFTVLRRHPFPPEFWRSKPTKHVKELVSRFQGHEELLTTAYTTLLQSQIDVFNSISSMGHESSRFSIPNWEPVSLEVPNDRSASEKRFYLKRPLIPGERDDLRDMMGMSFDETLQRFSATGSNMALNFLLMRNSFLPRDQLTTEGDPKTGEVFKMISIGASESLCDSLRLGRGNGLRSIDPIKDYARKSSIIYGSHLFMMLATFMHRHDQDNASELPESRAQSFQIAAEYLEDALTARFVNAYRDQQKRNLRSIDSVDARYRELEDHFAGAGIQGGIPRDFDIRPQLPLMYRLLDGRCIDSEQYMHGVRKVAREMLENYKEFICDEDVKSNSSVSIADKASFIEALRSLRSNHVAYPGVARNVWKVAVKLAIEYKELSVKEREWLLGLTDVAAWVRTVQVANYKDICRAVGKCQNADDFAAQVNALVPGAYLSRHTAKRFYNAVQGLNVSYTAASPGNSKEAALKEALKMCTGVYELPVD
jgi:hypothetical protein